MPLDQTKRLHLNGLATDADARDTRPRALIVDGDAAAGLALAGFLSQNGLLTDLAADGRGMDRALASARYDIVILETILPGEDGLTICRRLSSAPVAVILKGAQCEEVDRIIGLELGADDCLQKSCSPRELLARIRVVIRRRRGSRARRPWLGLTYQFGGYELDTIHGRLFRPSGEVTALTKGEFQLLAALLDHEDPVVPREFLARIGGPERTVCSHRVVDVRVGRLRRKLGGERREEVIRAVKGIGYTISVPVLRTAWVQA